jgi:hypothetical protein
MSKDAAEPRGPARDFERLREQTRMAGTRFLLTELETALTLLDVGTSSRRQGTPERTRAEAQEAYDVVMRRLAKGAGADLNDAEQQWVTRTLAQLRQRLAVEPGADTP